MKKSDFDISAGGFVFSRENGILKVALLENTEGRFLLPKGLIGSNENALETARREITEELGLESNLKLAGDAGTSEYWYYFEGRKIHKKIKFFIFLIERSEKLKPQKEEGFIRAEWFTIPEALKKITFDRNLLETAVHKIDES